MHVDYIFSLYSQSFCSEKTSKLGVKYPTIFFRPLLLQHTVYLACVELFYSLNFTELTGRKKCLS